MKPAYYIIMCIAMILLAITIWLCSFKIAALLGVSYHLVDAAALLVLILDSYPAHELVSRREEEGC